LAQLDAALRQRHVAYLLGCQNADGGWSGREGDSDLYYSAFALRSLAVLDALSLEVCDRSAGFLRGCLTRQASVVDFFSLLYACLLIQAAGGPDVLEGSPPDYGAAACPAAVVAPVDLGAGEGLSASPPATFASVADRPEGAVRRR